MSFELENLYFFSSYPWLKTYELYVNGVISLVAYQWRKLQRTFQAQSISVLISIIFQLIEYDFEF